MPRPKNSGGIEEVGGGGGERKEVDVDECSERDVVKRCETKYILNALCKPSETKMHSN